MSIQEYHRWVKDNGDSTWRLNYPLNSSSVVFDLGGYRGDWTQSIFNLYDCKIFVFEPIPQFVNYLNTRFTNIEKIRIIPHASSTKDGTSLMSIDADSSSMFSEKSNYQISLIDIVKFIRDNNIDSIDLMKINIEGAEYDVMEYIIASGVQNIVRNFQIQYHENIPDFINRRNNISKQLSTTHEIKYCYEFVWEGWSRK